MELKAGGIGRAMSAYVDGDTVAFDHLYRALEPTLRTQIRRSIFDRAAVDDLLQITFLKAHRARARYVAGREADRSVLAWYRSIAHNVMVDHLRAHYRKRTEPHLEIVDLSRDPEAGLAARARDEKLKTQLNLAMAELTDKERSAVRDHHLKGLGMGEIAEAEGVRVGVVRVRAHRGYARLRHLLGSMAQCMAD